MTEQINYTDITEDRAAEAEPYEMINSDTDSDTQAEETTDAGDNAELSIDEDAKVFDNEDSSVAEDNSQEPDYDKIISEDIAALKEAFPELRRLSDITELANPMRYAALRDLGLTATEAYLATTPRNAKFDNRSHLSGAVPKAKSAPPTVGMTKAEWNIAKELFPDLTDSEIYDLYKRATR